MTRERLSQCGRDLFGDDWESLLAREIRVPLSTLRKWRVGVIIPRDKEREIEALMKRRAAA